MLILKGEAVQKLAVKGTAEQYVIEAMGSVDGYSAPESEVVGFDSTR